MSNKRGFFSLVVLSLFFFCFNSSLAFAQDVKTIAVFPFEVIAQEDFAFLGKGLTRMICSRTGDSGQIRVDCRTRSLESFGIEITPETLESLSTSEDFSGLDFFVKGTLTILGSTVSTDAELIDLKQGKVVCYFHESGGSQQDIVRHASIIAGKIKTIVLGGPVPISHQEVFNSGETAKNGIKNHEVLPAPIVFKSSTSAPVSTGAIFRSRTFETQFSGLASGDVDGDGQADLVLIDEHSVNLFSFENGTLVKKGQFQGKHYETFKAVDVADINKNKKAEVFITAVDQKANVCSVVLEWDQGGFSTQVKDSDWYYRVVSINGNKHLYGQQGGYSELFSGSVFSLDWDGVGYNPNEAISLPPNVDIFSFARGDVLGRGADQTLWLDQEGKLNLSSSSGKIEWSSPASFGSTPLFLGERAGQDLDDQERTYINSRMALVDLDGDGHNEAVLVHNQDLSRGFFGRFRKFTSGSVTALSWSSVGIKTLWETEQVKGFIADWALEDLDNDGRPELIYCIGIDSGTILNKKQSNIVVEKIQ